MSYVFIGLGLLMLWQGLGAYGYVQRIALHLFRNNVYFVAANIAIGKFAAVLGIASVLYGCAGIWMKRRQHKLGVSESAARDKNNLDVMVFVTMVVLFIVTVV